MKKITFSLLTLAVIVCAGCASSERMLRLGADHSNYVQPESSRLEGFTKNQNADAACDTKMDDRSVNLWPLYFSSAKYTSILWPMIDWDEYGWAFRPLYNKEGMDHSVLWPLCTWNTGSRAGWFSLFYWDKENFGTLFLFNTPVNKGLHYYGPFWFYTSDYRYPSRNSTAARDKKWGVFPLLWMNMGKDRDYSMLYPVAGWNSNFYFQKHLNFIGPFWNWEHECGIFPVFHWNYGAPGKLRSFLFPLYYRSSDMFLSLPYSYRKQEYGKIGRRQSEVLNCARKTLLTATEWYSILFAYWGKDRMRFVTDGKEAECRYFGFSPLFSREKMADWSKFGFGPFNWIAGWNCGPNVKQFHLLGPFGFRRMAKENTELDFWNTEKRFSNFSALMLCHWGEEDHLLWKEPQGTQYTSAPGYLNLTFQLYRMAATKKPQAQNLQKIQQTMRLCQITDPMPKTQMEAGILAYKLEQQFHTEKQHSSFHSFFPFWYCSNAGSRSDLLLPFLLSSWSTGKNGDTDSIFATPLVFRKTHRISRNYMGSLQDPGNTDMAEITSHSRACTEYDLFRLLGWQQERFCVPFWKQGVTEEIKKQKNAYWRDCGDGRISWQEAAKREQEYVARNTELRTYSRNSFLSDLLYLSLNSDQGEHRMYLAGGFLAQREAVRDADDLHVLWFLYRYQKKADAEREFIFPFILKQKAGNKEKFSFCWRLFDREYTDGKCTGGHILFIPY